MGIMQKLVKNLKQLENAGISFIFQGKVIGDLEIRGGVHIALP